MQYKVSTNNIYLTSSFKNEGLFYPKGGKRDVVKTKLLLSKATGNRGPLVGTEVFALSGTRQSPAPPNPFSRESDKQPKGKIKCSALYLPFRECAQRILYRDCAVRIPFRQRPKGLCREGSLRAVARTYSIYPPAWAFDNPHLRCGLKAKPCQSQGGAGEASSNRREGTFISLPLRDSFRQGKIKNSSFLTCNLLQVKKLLKLKRNKANYIITTPSILAIPTPIILYSLALSHLGGRKGASRRSPTNHDHAPLSNPNGQRPSEAGLGKALVKPLPIIYSEGCWRPLKKKRESDKIKVTGQKPIICYPAAYHTPRMRSATGSEKQVNNKNTALNPYYLASLGSEGRQALIGGSGWVEPCPSNTVFGRIKSTKFTRSGRDINVTALRARYHRDRKTLLGRIITHGYSNLAELGKGLNNIFFNINFWNTINGSHSVPLSQSFYYYWLIPFVGLLYINTMRGLKDSRGTADNRTGNPVVLIGKVESARNGVKRRGCVARLSNSPSKEPKGNAHSAFSLDRAKAQFFCETKKQRPKGLLSEDFYTLQTQGQRLLRLGQDVAWITHRVTPLHPYHSNFTMKYLINNSLISIKKESARNLQYIEQRRRHKSHYFFNLNLPLKLHIFRDFNQYLYLRNTPFSVFGLAEKATIGSARYVKHLPGKEISTLGLYPAQQGKQSMSGVGPVSTERRNANQALRSIALDEIALFSPVPRKYIDTPSTYTPINKKTLFSPGKPKTYLLLDNIFKDFNLKNSTLSKELNKPSFTTLYNKNNKIVKLLHPILIQRYPRSKRVRSGLLPSAARIILQESALKVQTTARINRRLIQPPSRKDFPSGFCLDLWQPAPTVRDTGKALPKARLGRRSEPNPKRHKVIFEENNFRSTSGLISATQYPTSINSPGGSYKVIKFNAAAEQAHGPSRTIGGNCPDLKCTTRQGRPSEAARKIPLWAFARAFGNPHRRCGLRAKPCQRQGGFGCCAPKPTQREETLMSLPLWGICSSKEGSFKKTFNILKNINKLNLNYFRPSSRTSLGSIREGQGISKLGLGTSILSKPRQIYRAAKVRGFVRGSRRGRFGERIRRTATQHCINIEKLFRHYNSIMTPKKNGYSYCFPTINKGLANTLLYPRGVANSKTTLPNKSRFNRCNVPYRRRYPFARNNSLLRLKEPLLISSGSFRSILQALTGSFSFIRAQGPSPEGRKDRITKYFADRVATGLLKKIKKNNSHLQLKNYSILPLNMFRWKVHEIYRPGEGPEESKNTVPSINANIRLLKTRKNIQKKRRKKKLKKETRRRKKRKRFYPRPILTTFKLFKNFLNLNLYSFRGLRLVDSLSDTTKILYSKGVSYFGRKPHRVGYFFPSEKSTLSKKLRCYPLSKNLYKLNKYFKFNTSQTVLNEFRRLSWKSTWTRSNFSPYLTRVNIYFKKLKNSTRQLQNLNLMNHMRNSILGPLESYNDLNMFSSTSGLLEIPLGYTLSEATHQGLHPKSSQSNYTNGVGLDWARFACQPYSNLASRDLNLGKEPPGHWTRRSLRLYVATQPKRRQTPFTSLSQGLDKWKIASKTREYNRVLYQRIQDIIFNIKENITLNGQNKVRAYKNGHNWTTNLLFPTNNKIKENLIEDSFIKKLLLRIKAFGFESTDKQNPQSPASKNSPNLKVQTTLFNLKYLLQPYYDFSKLRLYWGVNKTKVNKKIINIWSKQKFRESASSGTAAQTNKTKKLLSVCSKKLEKILNIYKSIDLNETKIKVRARRGKAECRPLFFCFTKKLGTTCPSIVSPPPFNKGSKKYKLLEDINISIKNKEDKLAYFAPWGVARTSAGSFTRYEAKVQSQARGAKKKPALKVQSASKAESFFPRPAFKLPNSSLFKNKGSRYKSSDSKSKARLYRVLNPPKIFDGLNLSSQYWNDFKISIINPALQSKSSNLSSFAFNFTGEAKNKNKRFLASARAIKNNQQFLVWLSILVFHFCCFISLINISQIRCLLKIGLIFLSKFTSNSINFLLLFPKISNIFPIPNPLLRVFRGSGRSLYWRFLITKDKSANILSLTTASTGRSPVQPVSSAYRPSSVWKGLKNFEKLKSARDGESDNDKAFRSSPLRPDLWQGFARSPHLLYYIFPKVGLGTFFQRKKLPYLTHDKYIERLKSNLAINYIENKFYIKTWAYFKDLIFSTKNKVEKKIGNGLSIKGPRGTANILIPRGLGRVVFSKLDLFDIFFALQKKYRINLFGKNYPTLSLADSNTAKLSLNSAKDLGEASLIGINFYLFKFLYFSGKNLYKSSSLSSAYIMSSISLTSNFVRSILSSIFVFLEKPGELFGDWLAFAFLVEWSSDLSNTIPEKVDYSFYSTFSKIIRPLQIQPLIHNRFLKFFDIFFVFLNQPDTDLIHRQNKGFIFWDLWADHLVEIAEKANINIATLSNNKEEQNLLFQELLINSSGMMGKIKAINPLWALARTYSRYRPAWALGRTKPKHIYSDLRQGGAGEAIPTLLRRAKAQREGTKYVFESLPLWGPQGTSDNPTGNQNIKSKKLGLYNSLKSVLKLDSTKQKYLLPTEGRSIARTFSAGHGLGTWLKPKSFDHQGQRHNMRWAVNPNLKNNNNIYNTQNLFIDIHPPKSLRTCAHIKNYSLKDTTKLAKLFKNKGPIGSRLTFNIIRSGRDINIPSLRARTRRGDKEAFSRFRENKFLFLTSPAINNNNIDSPKGVRSSLPDSLRPAREIYRKSAGYDPLIGFLPSKNEQPICNLVCQVFSGIFYKQVSKNLLILGRANQKEEKSLLVQAIAGETELRIITDNAYRYSMVYQGVAVGIKLLRDVFDAIALHTPCLFLLEDIHAIGERRPLLISDGANTENLSSGSEREGFPGNLEDSHSANQVLYQLSKHTITHYKKPFKGDFSLSIPTNVFSFDLFSTPNNSFKPLLKKINKSPIIFDTKITGAGSGGGGLENLRLVSSLEGKGPVRSNKILNTKLEKKTNPLLAPPATSPFSVLILKEQQKKSNPLLSGVDELPWEGLPAEQLAIISKSNYSIRVKVALLADLAMSNLSVKLDMITDLLVIIDSVRGNRGFVVFATTHLPFILDPALRRPGRLDETLTLSLTPTIFNKWESLKFNIVGYNDTLSFSAINTSLGTKGLIDLLRLPPFNQKRIAYNTISNSENYKDLKRPISSSPLLGDKIYPCPRSKEDKRIFNSRCLLPLFSNGLNKKSKGLIATFLKNQQKIKIFKLKNSINPQNPFHISNQKNLYLSIKRQAPPSLKARATSLVNLKGLGWDAARTKSAGRMRTPHPSASIAESPTPLPGDIAKLIYLKLKNKIKNKTSQTLAYLIENPTSSKEKGAFAHPEGKIRSLGAAWQSRAPDVINPVSKGSELQSKHISSLSDQPYSNIASRELNLGLARVAPPNHLLEDSSLNINTVPIFISLYGSKVVLKNYILKLVLSHTADFYIEAFSAIPNLYRKGIFAHPEGKANTADLFIGSPSRTFNYLSSTKDLSNSLITSLLFSFIQKRYIYQKNLIIPQLLSLGFGSNSGELDPKDVPSPPASNILLPAKKYENFKRLNFFSFNISKDTFSIDEKIQNHNQQILLKDLLTYNKEKFTSNPLKQNSNFEVREGHNMTCSAAEKYTIIIGRSKNLLVSLKKQLLQYNSKLSFPNTPTSTNLFYRYRIYNRHKNYLSNLWSNAQLPEHNIEATFLSDIDWRSKTFKLKKDSLYSKINDCIIDFPDADQYYNPRNRRWFLTYGTWNSWFNFNQTEAIINSYILEGLSKALNVINQNREILDYLAVNNTKNLSVLYNYNIEGSVRTQKDLYLYTYSLLRFR